MFFSVIANLILLIAFSILIFWPFFNNDKIYNLIERQSPIFSIIVGLFFAMIAIILHFLSPGLASEIFSNSRILLIIYSGLVGGPLAVLTSSGLIVFTRDLLGSISELTIIMKWHTIITGIIISCLAIKYPITLKNLHYYYVATLLQFSIVIVICYLIYDMPMLNLFNFIIFFAMAYFAIYIVLKRYKDSSQQLQIIQNMHINDFITNMPNNRTSEEYLQKLLNKKIPFELLHIDIDLFKNFNVENMYRVGDEMLRQIAIILKTVSAEKNAFIGRIGGDEFCLILVNSNPATAVHVAYEINRMINGTNFKFNNQEYALTVSICVSSYPQNGQTLEELYLATINGLKVITTSDINTVAHVNQLKLEGKLT